MGCLGLRELNLSGAHIREIDSMQDVFTNLKEINLENNQLTSIKGLYITTLTSLKLANNRVERLDDLCKHDVSFNQSPCLPYEDHRKYRCHYAPLVHFTAIAPDAT